MCASVVRPIELGFLDYEAGRMDKLLWQGQKNTIVYWFTKPGIERWLDQYGQTLYPNFEQYLKDVIAKERKKAKSQVKQQPDTEE